MIYIKSKIKLPDYVKETVRTLICPLADYDVDVHIRKHQEEKTDNQ